MDSSGSGDRHAIDVGEKCVTSTFVGLPYDSDWRGKVLTIVILTF